jgi:glycopeptide antibiotics resistance protein
MILSNRSLTRSSISMLREKNAAFRWVMAGTVLVMGLVLAVPLLQGLFQFGAFTVNDLLLALTGGIAAVGMMELLKLVSWNKISRTEAKP